MGILVLLFVSAFVSIATPPASTALSAFPSVIMIRGGELTQPIVLHHVYDHTDANAFENDPIVRFYSGRLNGTQAPIPANHVEYEVAEFWGPHWVRDYGRDGRPIPGLQFLDANRTGLIFVTRHTVLWTSVSASPQRLGEHHVRGTTLSPDAIDVLFKSGIPKP